MMNRILPAALFCMAPAIVQAAAPDFSQKSSSATTRIQQLIPITTRIDIEYEHFSAKAENPPPYTLSTEEMQEVLAILQQLRPLQKRGMRYVKYKGTHKLVFLDQKGKVIGSLSLISVTATPASATDQKYSADAKHALPLPALNRLKRIITRKTEK